jgi:hypothetical protein
MIATPKSRLLPVILKSGKRVWSHALEWTTPEPPRKVFFMIPGNPGVIEFYTEFLSHLFQLSKGTMHILAGKS